MDKHNISFALEAVISFISGANVFAEQHKPWEIAKDPSNSEEVYAVLNHMVEVVAISSVLLKPIIPEACERIQAQLKAPFLDELTLDEIEWGMIPLGHEVAKPKPVFPRIQLEKAE